MKLLKAGSFYDCFLGDGWSNHVRVRVKRTPYGPRIHHVAGLPLTKELLISIGEMV